MSARLRIVRRCLGQVGEATHGLDRQAAVDLLQNMQRRERSTLSRYAGVVSGNEAGVVREGAYVPEARKMSAFVESLLQNNFGSKSDARCT
jgi:hypothetical protein